MKMFPNQPIPKALFPFPSQYHHPSAIHMTP